MHLDTLARFHLTSTQNELDHVNFRSDGGADRRDCINNNDCNSKKSAIASTFNVSDVGRPPDAEY